MCIFSIYRCTFFLSLLVVLFNCFFVFVVVVVVVVISFCTTRGRYDSCVDIIHSFQLKWQTW